MQCHSIDDVDDDTDAHMNFKPIGKKLFEFIVYIHNGSEYVNFLSCMCVCVCFFSFGHNSIKKRTLMCYRIEYDKPNLKC